MARQETVLMNFVAFWGGFHPSAWREKGSAEDPTMDFEHIKRVLQTCERGKFHGFFLADGVATWPERTPEAMSRTSNAVRYEPFTLCAALSAYTKHIGLAMTASTTYNEPYHVARKFASLDHLTGGRACWNVVTSANLNEAQNFGLEELMDPEVRYRRADEMVEIVKGLWDSWEDDAFLKDKESGVYFDVDRLHTLNHEGEFFKVKGPLIVERPVQGYPVLAQAGSSEHGLDFAMRQGELIFVHGRDMEEGPAMYRKIKDGVARAGRDPDHVLVLQNTSVILGRTRAEAEERVAHITKLLDPLVGLDRLAFVLGSDLSGYPLDGPVPKDLPFENKGPQSLRELYLSRAYKDNLTIRQLAEISASDFVEPMGIKEMADHIEERHNVAADGFNMSFSDVSASLELFVDEVVPELQRRGIFHEDYEGGTLRENLGLPRPQNRYRAPSSTPA